MAALPRRGVVAVEQGPGDSKARGGKRPALAGFKADCGRLAGVEIGASRVRIELADLNGATLSRLTLAVHPERGAGRILEVIAKGIAAPGRVDPRQGVVLEAGNVFIWHDVAVREHLEKAPRLPVVVDNDVNLAALGEMHGGVAVGLRNFVLIRLTTGIGAGVVREGKLWQGSHWAAGEIGHIL
jgi:glucokinase